MYTLYKFHFLNGISEINQLFDDILIIWPAPVCMYVCMYVCMHVYMHVYMYMHMYIYVYVYIYVYI